MLKSREFVRCLRRPVPFIPGAGSSEAKRRIVLGMKLNRDLLFV